MDKTRVDDMLMEMITPKIKEIEKKFTSRQGLNQEDINTLLLKSQHNHISHLDNKLNEVANSIVALEKRFDTKFEILKKRFMGLENKFDLLSEKMEHTMQKALNNNMMSLIAMIGAMLILSKIIDKF